MIPEHIPWKEENLGRRYVFYVLHIIDCDKIQDKYTALCDALQYAYSNNRWIFDQFLKFWGIYLNDMDYEIIETPPLTIEAYVKYMHVKFSHTTNYKREFIWMSKLNVIDLIVYTTGQMEEDTVELYMDDGNSIDDLFLDYIMGASIFVKKADYLLDTEDAKIVKELMRKLSNVYVPLYILLTQSDNFLEFPEGWFLELPDYLKVYFTKEANFPMPIEQLSTADMMDTTYITWYYIVYAYDYPANMPYLESDAYGNNKEVT